MTVNKRPDNLSQWWVIAERIGGCKILLLISCKCSYMASPCHFLYGHLLAILVLTPGKIGKKLI